jgi:hypothetical protein
LNNACDATSAAKRSNSRKHAKCRMSRCYPPFSKHQETGQMMRFTCFLPPPEPMDEPGSKE